MSGPVYLSFRTSWRTGSIRWANAGKHLLFSLVFPLKSKVVFTVFTCRNYGAQIHSCYVALCPLVVLYSVFQTRSASLYSHHGSFLKQQCCQLANSDFPRYCALILNNTCLCSRNNNGLSSRHFIFTRNAFISVMTLRWDGGVLMRILVFLFSADSLVKYVP